MRNLNAETQRYINAGSGTEFGVIKIETKDRDPKRKPSQNSMDSPVEFGSVEEQVKAHGTQRPGSTFGVQIPIGVTVVILVTLLKLIPSQSDLRYYAKPAAIIKLVLKLQKSRCRLKVQIRQRITRPAGKTSTDLVMFNVRAVGDSYPAIPKTDGSQTHRTVFKSVARTARIRYIAKQETNVQPGAGRFGRCPGP